MSSKKCYVLIVSRNFAKSHPKAGEPTNFIELIQNGIKKHTIRGNYPLWEKRIEAVNQGKAYISLRYWSGTPYRSHQVEIKRLFKAGIQKIHLYHVDDSYKVKIIGATHSYDLSQIARNDGLKYQDFINWFFNDSSDPELVQGAIIHFTDFRY